MIGNGFDLACGLKTRYTDVYKEYCVLNENDSYTVKLFKKTIIGKDDRQYENWKDFEMALLTFAKELNDFDKFEECILNFTEYLDNYLEKQETCIDIETNKNFLIANMKKYIYGFYSYCLLDSRSILETKVKLTTQSCLFNFITFNYTNTLEKTLKFLNNNVRKRYSSHEYYYHPPIHIHSTLNNGILLGLDNEEFYKDIPCVNKRKLKNLIDKIVKNSRQSNIVNSTEALLGRSDIIIIYGWSMGDSDSFWVNSIKEGFNANKKMQLVYVPYYEDSLNSKYSHETLNREDEMKQNILEKFELSENDATRIHIITNDNYMDLAIIGTGSPKTNLDKWFDENQDTNDRIANQ